LPKIFFVVSGEHESLPFSELEAILEAENVSYRVLEKHTQVLVLEAPKESVKIIADRSALTRICAVEIFRCGAEYSEIIEEAACSPIEDYIREGESFVVRVKRVAGSSPHLSTIKLERKIGEIILSSVGKVKVNLFRPEKTFFGVITDDYFFFGLKLAEILPKPFIERRPKKKPFFHPSAMPAKLSRCMVNLARAKAGDLLLDPFCGTGSILIEAGFIGCKILGCDAKRLMVKGSLRNLTYYGLKPNGLVVADARKPPFTYADCVATDPPYGRSATTMKSTTKEIVYETLQVLAQILPKGGHVCMASPKTIGISEIGKELGYKHLESHFVYVHRSLTREIAVFKRE